MTTADEDRKKSEAPALPVFEETELYKLLITPTAECMRKCLPAINCMSRQEINNRSKNTGNGFLHTLVHVSRILVTIFLQLRIFLQ